MNTVSPSTRAIDGSIPPLPTEFASAERDAADQIHEQVTLFMDAPPIVGDLVGNIPDILTVLNDKRQVVYANQVLLNYLGIDSQERIQGLRPGEILDCIHAVESDGGCGTTEFCKTCGAVQAILASQQGKKNTKECRIIQRSGEALDLRVWATPITYANGAFTVFSVADISHEKRRRALERIFFHDILNTAGGLQGFAELLDKVSPEDVGEVQHTISDLSHQLIDEILAQRQLSAAENEELVPEKKLIQTSTIATDVLRTYRNHLVAEGRHVQLDPGIVDVELHTDPVILRRVIGNMIKNALEASKPGQAVTLGCDHQDGWVRFWVHNPKVMPRHIQLQIFQRSFSTKGTGRGLGTYSMKLLSERYLDGRVSFASEEGMGTIFMAYYPQVADVADVADAA